MSLSSDSPSAAVERALAMLEAVAQEAEGLSNAEISRKLQIPKSSASYILRTLESRNYLTRDEESGKYRVGLKILSLSRGALSGLDVRGVALPIMRHLTHQTGLTSIWQFSMDPMRSTSRKLSRRDSSGWIPGSVGGCACMPRAWEKLWSRILQRIGWRRFCARAVWKSGLLRPSPRCRGCSKNWRKSEARVMPLMTKKTISVRAALEHRFSTIEGSSRQASASAAQLSRSVRKPCPALWRRSGTPPATSRWGWGTVLRTGAQVRTRNEP